MTAKVDVIEKYLVEETLTEEQKNELKEVLSELQEFFPDYESALYALAKIATLTTFRPDAPKDAIDIETRFFEILFRANNWSEGTKLGLSKFMRPSSRIAKIVQHSISMQASAMQERAPQGKIEATKKKYDKAKDFFMAEPEKYSGYKVIQAATNFVNDFPGHGFSVRKLQDLIPTWTKELEK